MKAICSVDSARLTRRAYSPRHAFDIDPKRPQRYRLRLSRYMDLARKHLVPRLAGILRHPETASHLQAFSLFSFLRLLRAYPSLSVVKARGFRIISGGLLRPLENYRWWWQLNTRLGELLPALCIEVQIILRKSSARP